MTDQGFWDICTPARNWAMDVATHDVKAEFWLKVIKKVPGHDYM